MIRNLMRAAAALTLAAGLGGCAVLGLLGGGGGKNPAQLYRFGGGDPVASALAAPANATPVRLASLTFQPAADGDRLLAVNGAEAFYIANSRWVSPAEQLFIEAARRAFDRSGLQLVRPDQPINSDVGVTLTVPVFETRYEAGPQAPPTVVVEIRAALAANRTPLGSTQSTVSTTATANTVTAIVAAYDASTRQALDSIAAWTATTARAAPPRAAS